MVKRGQNAAELILLLAALLVVGLISYFVIFEMLAPASDIKIAESRAYWSGISYGVQLHEWKMQVYSDGSVPATEANLSVLVKNPLADSMIIRQITITQGAFGHVWFLQDGTYAGHSDDLEIFLNPGDSVQLIVQHYQNGVNRYTPPEVYELDTTIIYDNPRIGAVSQVGNIPVIGKIDTYDGDATLDSQCPSNMIQCPAGSQDCCPSANCINGVCKTNLCSDVTCDVPGCEICDRATGDCYCTDATTPPEYYCSNGESCVLREVRSCADGLGGYDSSTMMCTDNCAAGEYCNADCSCVERIAKACASLDEYDSETMLCSDTDCSVFDSTACDLGTCSCVDCPTERLCGSICCSDGEKCADPLTETCVSACESYEFECASTDGSATVCCTSTPQQYCATLDGTCCDTPVCEYTDNGQPVSECCDLTSQGCDAETGCCQDTPDAYCNEAEGIFCCDGYICNQNKCYCVGDCCQNLLDGYCNTTLFCCDDQIPSLHCVIEDGETEGVCDDNCPDGYTTLADGSCCPYTKVCSEGSNTCCGAGETRYISSYGEDFPQASACLCCDEGSEPCGDGDTMPVCCPEGQCSVDGVCCDTSNPNIETCTIGPNSVACCDASEGLVCVESTDDGEGGLYGQCCEAGNDACDFYGEMQCCAGTCFTNSNVLGNSTNEKCCPPLKSSGFCDDGKCCGHACNPQDDTSSGSKCCSDASDEVCDDGDCCSECFEKAGTSVSQCCDDELGTTEVCKDGTCCISPGGCASRGVYDDVRCCENAATEICTGDDECCVTGCVASSGSSGDTFCCEDPDPEDDEVNAIVCDNGCCDTNCVDNEEGEYICCEAMYTDPATSYICGGECCPIGDCYNQDLDAEVCCETAGEQGDDLGHCCPSAQIQERPTDGARVCCDGEFDSYGTCCDHTPTSKGGKSMCCDNYVCYADDTGVDLACCDVDCYGGSEVFPTCCDTGESVCQTNPINCCPDGMCFEYPGTGAYECCPPSQIDFCYSKNLGDYACCDNCLTFNDTGYELCCPLGSDVACMVSSSGDCDVDCCGDSNVLIDASNVVSYDKPTYSLDIPSALCCSADSTIGDAPATAICVKSFGNKFACCGAGYSCVQEEVAALTNPNTECCPESEKLCNGECCGVGNECTTIDLACCPVDRISTMRDNYRDSTPTRCCPESYLTTDGSGECCDPNTHMRCSQTGGGGRYNGETTEWCCPIFLGCGDSVSKCGPPGGACPSGTSACGTTCCPYGLSCDATNNQCYFICQNKKKLEYP